MPIPSMNIAWLTDIHLNFLNAYARIEFYQGIVETHADAIVITGDIAEAKDVDLLLSEFSTYINKPIYFVLGNHDYYFGSVEKVREKIRALCIANPKLIWLGKPEIVHLTKDTLLIGQDGWADARYGDFDHSWVALNDSRLIADLYQAYAMNPTELKKTMQALADRDAMALQKTLTKAVHKDTKKVIIATHVPPFAEASWHKDKPSDKDWLPYFSSKATGDVILTFVKKHAQVHFLVLCGHTHTAARVKLADNLVVQSGHAEYYQPEVQEIIAV